MLLPLQSVHYYYHYYYFDFDFDFFFFGGGGYSFFFFAPLIHPFQVDPPFFFSFFFLSLMS